MYEIVIACRNHCREGFPPEKEVVASELEGQPCEASRILTFLLSKASRGACRTYLSESLYNLCLQVYCALCLGFEWRLVALE
jgi:hypothetical protein